MTPGPMDAIIAAVGAVFTSAVAWITTIAGFVVSTPIVLFFVAIVVVGIAIGWLKRFVPAMGGKRGKRR